MLILNWIIKKHYLTVWKKKINDLGSCWLFTGNLPSVIYPVFCSANVFVFCYNLWIVMCLSGSRYSLHTSHRSWKLKIHFYFWLLTLLLQLTDQSGVACHLPAVLGLPADLLSVLGARGVWHWLGHHAYWCPCLFLGRVLGKQAPVFQYICW